MDLDKKHTTYILTKNIIHIYMPFVTETECHEPAVEPGTSIIQYNIEQKVAVIKDFFRSLYY